MWCEAHSSRVPEEDSSKQKGLQGDFFLSRPKIMHNRTHQPTYIQYKMCPSPTCHLGPSIHGIIISHLMQKWRGRSPPSRWLVWKGQIHRPKSKFNSFWSCIAFPPYSQSNEQLSLIVEHWFWLSISWSTVQALGTIEGTDPSRNDYCSLQSTSGTQVKMNFTSHSLVWEHA